MTAESAHVPSLATAATPAVTVRTLARAAAVAVELAANGSAAAAAAAADVPASAGAVEVDFAKIPIREAFSLLNVSGGGVAACWQGRGNMVVQCCAAYQSAQGRRGLMAPNFIAVSGLGGWSTFVSARSLCLSGSLWLSASLCLCACASECGRNRGEGVNMCVSMCARWHA